ncbi:MAG: hypothetical protein U1A78_12350 [Polyangia bacterium]
MARGKTAPNEPIPRSAATPAPAPGIAEHMPPPSEEHGPGYTVWHPLLAQTLVRLLPSSALEVHPFVKLGTLPLEADIILLRKSAEADLLALCPELGFLLRFLSHYLLIEYKSPLDRLTCDDFDTARAYAMLCKRKYGLVHDEHVAMALLYSRAEPAFFATCARNGYAFVEQAAGIRACEAHPLRVYAIDLFAYGQADPENPINLFSKHFRTYRPTDPRWDGLLFLLRGEMRHMQTRLKGQAELQASLDEYIDRELAQLPPEQLLRHVPMEERLRGVPAEERLRGLSEEERRRLRELLDQPGPKPRS